MFSHRNSDTPGKKATISAMNWKHPHLRKWIALGILALGIGWVVSREVRSRKRHDMTLVVVIPASRRGDDSRLRIRVENSRGEDLFSRESVVRNRTVRASVKLLPGRYKVLMELTTPSGSIERQALFDVPGPDVGIEFP